MAHQDSSGNRVFRKVWLPPSKLWLTRRLQGLPFSAEDARIVEQVRAARTAEILRTDPHQLITDMYRGDVHVSSGTYFEHNDPQRGRR